MYITEPHTLSPSRPRLVDWHLLGEIAYSVPYITEFCGRPRQSYMITGIGCRSLDLANRDVRLLGSSYSYNDPNPADNSRVSHTNNNKNVV